MVGCDATGQSAPHKVRVRPALTDRRSLPRPLRPQQPAGLPGIAQSLREWVGFRSRPHHHFSTPNLYRLGVFVSGFPDAARGSAAFCVCHAVKPHRPKVAQFDSLLLSLLSKPAPTSWRKRTQATSYVNDLRVRHGQRLSIALGWAGHQASGTHRSRRRTTKSRWVASGPPTSSMALGGCRYR